MNLQFFYLMNLTMISRLVYVFNNNRLTKRQWGIVIAIQLLSLAVFQTNINLWILLVTLLLVNLITGYLEVCFKQLEVLRFSILIVFVVIFSIFFSSSIDLEFNPYLSTAYRDWEKYSGLLVLFRQIGFQKISIVGFGLLLVMNEVNLLIRGIFQIFTLSPSQNKHHNEKHLIIGVDPKEYNAGRIIGILERFLMFFLVLKGDIGSIGFILAAKGFVRFRELEERPFAEYVLIGTLISTFCAILIAIITKTILN